MNSNESAHLTKLYILDSSHSQSNSRVKMSPRYPTTNSNPYHKCQTIAHTNVEEPSKELITPGTITQHYLPHCTVSQQHQGEGSQALS